MYKYLLQVLKNRVQVQLLDTVLDILIATLQEYRRANHSGLFDISNKNDYEQNSNKNHFNKI